MSTNKTTKIIKLSAKDIISTREKLDKEITNYWNIIKTENVISKKAKSMGKGSNYDLFSVYNTILQDSEKRIKLKGMLQYINMGILDFNYEDFKKTHYYTIFAACEEKEKIAHWKDLISKKCFINPVEKSKKGMKGTGKIETFSYAKINANMRKIQLSINSLNAKIAKFNDETLLNITSESEDFATNFAA